MSASLQSISTPKPDFQGVCVCVYPPLIADTSALSFCLFDPHPFQGVEAAMLCHHKVYTGHMNQCECFVNTKEL